jgi:hypothetical protein
LPAVLASRFLLERAGVIVVELQREIADAVLAGAEVDAIEGAIIGPAPLDGEQKAVLWLYAHALHALRGDRMLAHGASRR